MTSTLATRQRLLLTGLQMVAEHGFHGLVLRELAKRAGVNLGSFVYHFGTKEQFIREMMEVGYAPLLERVKSHAESRQYTSAVERLTGALEGMVDFLTQPSVAQVVKQLFTDALLQQPAAKDFLAKMPGRHPQVLLQLIVQAQQEGGVVQGPPVNVLMFIVSAVGFPLVLFAGQDALKGMPMAIREIAQDPASARQRLGWALEAITLPGRKA